MVNIFSFFSGIGLLDLGFELSNFNVVYVNEYHQPFLDAYKYARDKIGLPHPQYGYHNFDIQQLFQDPYKSHLLESITASKTSAKYTGFIGGPPCPDFSIGGKNKGYQGENGQLSQTYVDAICEFKPDFFLFENVKGLWRTKKHREFYDRLKNTLVKSGYILTDRLINAIEYGVAQDRQRIILLGFHKDTIGLNNKAIAEAIKKNNDLAFPWSAKIKYPKNSAFDYAWPNTEPYIEHKTKECPEGIPERLTIEYWFAKNQVKEHPNAKHHFTPRAALSRFQSIDEGDSSKKSFKRLHRWRYSPTASYGNNEVHIHPYLPRRISAAEALAIQSAPAAFELPPNMTLSNMFKSIGNAVPFLASKKIAETINQFMGTNMRVDANYLIEAIRKLDKNIAYSYISNVTNTKVMVVDVERPEGPITIKRFDPLKGETPENSLVETISSQMLWRVANAITPNLPINLDRVLGGSYNTRSALETLIAYTPEFWHCKPGRIEITNSTTAIKKGHKHIVWRPGETHELGMLARYDTEIVISEIPGSNTVYDALTIPKSDPGETVSIDLQRRHAQMQVALMEIGHQFGYDIWIAQNDRGIEYRGQKIGEAPGVVQRLSDLQIFQAWPDAAKAAKLIDELWIDSPKAIPAVFEVEHSTGVTSGLSRMQNFQDKFPNLSEIKYIIVAADEDRDKVMRESNKEQFATLNPWFFPYSAVEELYGLVQRRNIKDIGYGFLDAFLEKCRV